MPNKGIYDFKLSPFKQLKHIEEEADIMDNLEELGRIGQPLFKGLVHKEYVIEMLKVTLEKIQKL